MCGGEYPDREQRSAPEGRGPLLPKDPAGHPEDTEVVLVQIGRGQERGEHAEANDNAWVRPHPAGSDQRCAHDERARQNESGPRQTERGPERYIGRACGQKVERVPVLGQSVRPKGQQAGPGHGRGGRHPGRKGTIAAGRQKR